MGRRSRSVVVCSMVIFAGCGGDPPALRTGIAPSPAQAQERQLIERAEVEISVESVPVATDELDSIVAQSGARVESSTADGDDRLEMELRVPAGSLRSVLDRLALLGEVKEERVRTTDVTNEVGNLDARLANLIAMRERLRGYMEEAEGLDELITLEHELTRIQTEIDSITVRLERLRGLVAMSSVTLTLKKKRTLGPLGALGSGTVWLVKKLFILD